MFIRLFIFLISFFSVLVEASEFHQTRHYSITVQSTARELKPLSQFWLKIDWQLQKNWHIYANNYKEDDQSVGAAAPTIEIKSPKGIQVIETVWSKPKDLKKYGISFKGYEDFATTYIKCEIDNTFIESAKNKVTLYFTIPVCERVCLVQNEVVELPYPGVSFIAENELLDDLNKNTKEETKLFIILLLSLLSGLMLNGMPCVFPVLALKILDLVKLREEVQLNNSNSIFKQHILGYILGVIASMLILSSLIIIYRMAGQQIGWGFQLQSPLFVALLAVVFAVFTLNLFGLVEIGYSIQSFFMRKHIYINQTKNPFVINFMNGVLACVVSTPCSAPFMGTAIAVALTQPYPILLSIFMCLGLGLSLPFIMILFYPKFLKSVPKPGQWMNKFKKLMALIMMSTVIWLLWIIYYQSIYICIITILMILFMSIYFILRNQSIVFLSLNKNKYIGLIVVFLFLSLSIYYVQNRINHESELLVKIIPYDEKTIEIARQKELPVFINFTAKWCLTCILNKKNVFESIEVQSVMRKKNVQYFEADWTQNDPKITKILESYGQVSIPFLIFYPAKASRPLMKSSIIMKDGFLDILNTK